MHRIWKALRDRRGFTLIEIAIVIAIIGILLLIALPLFSGARVRAYVAEARQIASEWKALAWSCLIQKNFKESKCDQNTETGWDPPATSDAWDWDNVVLACGTTATISPTEGASVCANDSQVWLAIRVPDTGNVTGLTNDYVFALFIDTGKTGESPATGESIATP